MAQKRYPFNVEKHAHDIIFRRNRAMNERSDKAFNGTLTAEEDERYEKLINDLGDLLDVFMGRDARGIVWLTGKEYGMARDAVNWACAMRS